MSWTGSVWRMRSVRACLRSAARQRALKAEYTLPNVSQSVILTRMEGRTPVPEKEQIESFAAHGATMVILPVGGQLARLSDG